MHILAQLERRDLALTVGNYGRTASVYNLVSQCTRFGLSADAARKEINQIANVVQGWREYFFASGVSAQDVEYIAPAFLPDCFFFEALPENQLGNKLATVVSASHPILPRINTNPPTPTLLAGRG